MSGRAAANLPVWEPGPGVAGPGGLGLPPLEGEVSADFCVIGLGGSGLSAVLELRRLGHSVVGLDAVAVGAGAAGRNGGLLLAGTAAFHHDAVRALGRERAVALYRLTEAERDRLLAAGEGGARRTGSLRIAEDASELADCEEQLSQMEADGLAASRYAGPEGEGLLFPYDGVLDPLARCRELARAAVAGGARLFERTRAVEVRGERVVTPGGAVRCNAVLVAVDGRLEELLPELEGEVRTARLQMLATAPTDELELPRPVYRRYGFEYYQRTRDGRIALGGFRDRAGASEWTRSGETGAEVQARLEEFLRRELGVSAPITHRWAASVGFRTGLLPFAAEVRESVWAIGGYNGTGNLVGAALGRAAAHVMSGGDRRDWELLAGS